MARSGHSNDRSAAASSGSLGGQALLSLILRKRWLFVFLIACACVSVSVIHFWLPVYEARTSLVFQTASSSPLQAVASHMASFGIQEDETRDMDRRVNRLNTQGFYIRVAQELRKKEPDLGMFHREMGSSKLRILYGVAQMLHLPVAESSMADMSDEEMADVLAGSVYFGAAGPDRMTVLVRSGDRRSAGVVLNVAADVAVAVLLSEGIRDLDDAQHYVELQAKQIESVIHEIGETLSKIRLNHAMSPDDPSAGSSTEGTEIQRQLTEATLSYEELQRRIAKLDAELVAEKQRDSSPGNANIDPQNRFGLPAKIAELKRQAELASLKQSTLRQLLDKVLQSENSGDGERIFELRKRMEFEYTIYEELKKQAFDLDMKRIGANNKVYVSDHVREYGASRTDNLSMKLAVALILSVFCGLPIALLWEMAWPSVRVGRDLTDAGLAYLGGIPVVAGRFAHDKRHHGPKICRFDSDSEVAMAFIQIRSRLIYLADRRETPTQAIAIVSAKPSEGKSFFARNLAASFGHMGRKTLLIDCDLRKAMTSDYFDLHDKAGLGEVLTGTEKFGSVVQRQILKGMDFVPAGRLKSSITDLFADGSLGHLLKDLREVYDQIILDTPSILAVPDAPLILRAADLPLLVSALNETSQHDLEVSLDRIRSLYTGDICAVLNRVTGNQVPLYVVSTGKQGNLFGSGGSSARGAGA